MYAIIEIAGQQFEVNKGQKVYIHRLASEEGVNVSFDRVLLIDNNGAITVDTPAINGALVEAKVLKHVKGDKVIVLRKKGRKGYKVKNGRRQPFTQIVVESIVVE